LLGALYVFSHPDYTVGSGISPDLLTLKAGSLEALAGSSLRFTAGGEFHPALKTQKPE
jgi:hypothetical protein